MAPKDQKKTDMKKPDQKAAPKASGKDQKRK
jgi:hypothetical protein